MSGPALLVVDVQRGFHDPRWGPHSNPDFEANLARLLSLWRERDWPLVYVRHDSTTPGSPFSPGTSGNELDEDLLGVTDPDVVITKSVSSAFHGTPSLDTWLKERGVSTVVVSGIQTNMCAETTARVAGNLGYRMLFALDATRTFDIEAWGGGTVTADELTRATAANLDDEFGEVVTTDDLVARATDGGIRT